MNKRPLRVLHCITSLLADGAQQMLLKLCSHGDRSNFRYYIVSLAEEGGLEECFERLDIPVISLGLKKSAPTFSALSQLSSIIKVIRPDIVQSWMYHANLAASLAKALARSDASIIWNIRRALYSTKQDRLLTRAVIRLNALLSFSPQLIIYCGSLIAQQHERNGFDKRKSLVIPNGFDTDKYRPSSAAKGDLHRLLQLPQNTPIIGAVGRFHPHKDHHTLFRAAATVTQAFPKVKFVLIGRGLEPTNAAVADWLERYQLTEHVSLLGERSDVASLIAGLDLFCSSSLSEGFPNAIGEAMACGIPCVTTDAGASPDIVGDTGIIVPRQAPEVLAAALLRLLTMPKDSLQTLGSQARERIERLFPIKNVVETYQKVYQGMRNRSLDCSSRTLTGIKQGNCAQGAQQN